MESTLEQLSKLSIETNDCSQSPQTYLKEALGKLLNPKHKKAAYEIISTCMQCFPKESEAAFIKEIDNLTKELAKDHSLKTILALFDAPHEIKKIVLESPKCICTFVLEALKETTLSFFQGDQLQEENIFIALKISVHILQCKGAMLVAEALKGDSISDWECSIIEMLISLLVAIVKCKELQKETLNITGIALAHIVNAVPRTEFSQSFASFLLKISHAAESEKVHSEMTLGPFRIDGGSGTDTVSTLSKIAILNGLVTVCSSESLLSRVSFELGQETIVKKSFNALYILCSTSLDPHSKYYAFQALSSWMDSVSQIPMEKYHCIKENEKLFMSSAPVCEKILELVWENRDDMIEGVPKIAIGIFGKLCGLHKLEKAALGEEFKDDKLIPSVTEQILLDPWYIRGKYTLLCEVLRHIDARQVLGFDELFASALCKCFGASNLVSAANECYKSFITSSLRETDRSNQVWNVDIWTRVFLAEFLSMLVSSNTRSAESCVLYFIPSTLQNMPEAFEVMKDVVLSQLTLASPREDQEVNHNWHRNRKRLLYGYCALLRIARKRGLASFADVDLNLLKESLQDNCDDLRSQAFALLCYNNKSTEPVNNNERSLVLDFLHVNLNCASSSFRQSLFVSMKNLLARIRDSCILMLRDFVKTQKRQKTGNGTLEVPDYLSSSIDLVECIISLAFQSLFPTGSFQRKKTGLQLIYTVLETFSSPKDAVKRGRTAESLKALTDWIHSIGKWKFVSSRNLVILISCLEDQHDEVRELALETSKWFTFDNLGMTPMEVEDFREKLVTKASMLSNSPRIRDAESGAILHEFIFIRFLNWAPHSIFEIGNPAEAAPAPLSKLVFSEGIVHLMFNLLRSIEAQIQEAYDDLLCAAFKQPIFGLIMAFQRCFSAFVQYLSSHGKSLEGLEKNLGILSRLVEASVRVCKKATEVALSVFACHDKATGGSPSFADMNLALENTMKQSRSFNATEESIGYQHCLELISSFCWLNLKAATLCLGEIGKLSTLDSLPLSEKNEVFTDKLLHEVGKIFHETLVNCRHKGVIENSCVGFQKLCKSVASIPSKAQILSDWLMETIQAVYRNDYSTSVTKRSAGLPMFVRPIVSACVKSPRFQFHKCIESLIEIAKRPLSAVAKEQSDLPQVQSMNILKTLFRDSSTGSEILKYAEVGLILSIEGFTSHSWSVRNAAQILLGALVPRMLGQRITQAEKSHHNSLNAGKFFKMYPKLLDFFVTILKSGVHYQRDLTHLPGLIPVLTILSKLRPCYDTELQSKFYPLLEDLVSCPVFTVRKLAATSLVHFIPIACMTEFIETWICNSRIIGQNRKHGFLLMMKHFFEIRCDDHKFAVSIPVDVISRISSVVLRTCDEPLLYSTLLEIFEVSLPVLYQRNNQRGLAVREYVRSAVVSIIQLLNSGKLFGTGLSLGAHLVPKRLARTSVCLIAREESSDPDFSCKVITELLSSQNELLVSETALAITQLLELGGTLREMLRLKIYHLTRDRLKVLDDGTDNINCIECCFAVLNGVQEFEIPLQKITEFLNDFQTLLIQGATHRQLAAVLPFIGLVFRSWMEKLTAPSKDHDEVFQIIDKWSELIFKYSSSSEREILRIGSLKALRFTAGSLTKYYVETNDFNQSSREDIVALMCARVVMALLNLIQDEDGMIRDMACDAVCCLNDSLDNAVACQLQPNLAMTSIFELIASEMANNRPLMQSLFSQLSNFYDIKVQHLTDSRAARLFEQKSSNLFAEDQILVDRIVHCLQVVQRQADADKRASQSTNLLVTLSNEFVVKRKEALSSLCQLEDYVTERSVYGCFGSQTVILAMNLCLRVLRLARNLSMDHDMDAIIKFLVKAKMEQDMHPLFKDQIDVSLALPET